MRRWRRWLAGTVLLALLGLLLAPATAPGTRLLATVVNRLPGITVAGVDGRLFGALRVERVSLALAGFELRLRQFHSVLRPGCLPRGELCFELLEAAALDLDLRMEEGGRDGARPAPLPFPVRAGRLAIGTLALQIDETALAFADVEAERLRAAERRISVRALALALDGVGRARAQARLALDRDWPLALDGTFEPAAALVAGLPEAVSLAGPVAVHAEGPPTALALSVDAAVDVRALGGRVQARGEGTLRWPALAVASLALDSPTGSVQARGDAALRARRARLSVTVSNLAPTAADWPLAPASGSGQLLLAFDDGPRVALSKLQLTSGWQGQALGLAGDAAWEPGMALPRLALSGTLAGLPWEARGGGGEPMAFALTSRGPFTIADVTLDGLTATGEVAADGSAVKARGSVAGLDGGAVSASGLELDATVTPGDAWSVTARGSAGGVLIAGQALEGVRFRGEAGAAGGALALSLAGAIAGDLALAATAGDGGRWDLVLEPLALATPLGQLSRDEALSLALQPAPWRAVFPEHCWALDAVSLCLAEGEAGSEGEIAAQLEGELVLPGGAVAALDAARGDLAGGLEARWGGGRSSQVEADLVVDGIRVTPAGLAEPLADPGRLALAASLRDVLSLEGELTGGALGAVNLSARRGSAGWRGDVAVAGASLAYLQPLLSGVSLLDGTVSGELALAAPGPAFVTGGQLALEGGRLRLRGSDAELEALSLTLRPGEGGDLAIDGKGEYGAGPVRITGTFDPAAPQLALDLEGQRNAVHWPGLLDATVSPTLALAYQDGTAALEGELRVHGGRLAPDQVGTGGVALSPDAQIVGDEGRQPLLRTRIDLRILVEERFRVVGDLVDATVGGDLRLRQAPAGPAQLFGRVAVVGGELRAYGQQLELREGSMAFTGDPENPQLDLRAERQFPAEALRVGFTVGGSLREPRLDLYSKPQLPREAQLSWLVRGRPPDAGASMDGTALALSVGTSALNQTSLVRSLNRLPGLSNVSLGTESGSAGTAATISGYVGDRLYLSYGMGLYEPVNTLTARLYLRARLWLEMVSALENSVDIYYRFDID
ncbi:MAG: translocation/assembly module TamB domain-containing protein [Pseudohaliea sp.]